MSVTMLAAPAAEPVGPVEAKDYLRTSGSSEDVMVSHLIAAARAPIEEATGVALITRSLRVALDWWLRATAERRWVRLPLRSAGALIAVRVFDGHGEPVTVTTRFTLPTGRQAKLMWTDGAFPWPGAAYRRNRDRLRGRVRRGVTRCGGRAATGGEAACRACLFGA